ncbi:enoyl-CoA hydratase/isomerase family protein [Paraburkholderia oxyphila]|uniref:enoyl-CoA hydratase/isomerase family protein n=1 Tax=Paraburkholderia oxyphila TaxID=614212 RepID=UPI000484579D|nr:enoyl-CoA hydratase/isomerase family protein [Paraburkholderia oxyphila]
MPHLSTYQDRFPNITIERDTEGVVLFRLHDDDGGPLKWGVDPDSIHAQLPDALYQIGRDLDNRVMILTGTGDHFCMARDPAKYLHLNGPEHIYRIVREARDILVNMVEIEVPVISAVNGPASYHPELTVLADIVLATPDTWFQDSHIRGGMVPGDGGQIVWQELLGITRANYFLLTEEKLTAQAALACGAVHEIVQHSQLLPRARAIASQLLKKSASTLRYSRIALNQALKERFTKELSHGLMAELLSFAAERGQAGGK